MAKPIVALCYDFDKTLSTTDMQNYTFIPALGMTPAEFWGAVTKFCNRTGMEKILAYMYMMIHYANKKGIKMDKEFLMSCGKDIKYFPGVTHWFKRINEYGESKGVKVEHYLISSGTKEIVEGCSIAKEFTELFGCEYYFNHNGDAVWPKYAMNYTQKTQFIFRVAKGVSDIKDDDSVNRKTSKYRVPYTNIIYIGDGMTDTASMTLVRRNGGKAIAVYSDESPNEEIKQMYTDGRVNFICKADYTSGSDIEKVIQLLIDSVSLNNELAKKEESLLKK
ncbi:MAG: haloacid dehalogenase-like hydrolase [Coprobacillus sp.]|nr:haloacid dehalogenase-like hydrolase [Coprobacillus sp.]